MSLLLFELFWFATNWYQRHNYQNHPTTIKDPSNQTTPSEFQAKWAQGLCFHCDKKYSPNHVCRFKQMRVLLFHEDEVEDDVQLEEKEPLEAEDKIVELSQNSVVGIDSP